MTLRAGRYELLDTIASGGMATVHLGRAVGAGGFERLVAIKTMHPHLSNEPDFVAMFLDEARLAARIRHPNVVGTIDIQQDEIGLLLVMEYVEGPSVSQMLRAMNKQKKQLPLDIAVRIMLDVLAGLHAAHELCGSSGEPLNVVHRDVSPQNILVTYDGVVKIVDFGVAKASSELANAATKDGQLKGKVPFMSPEQALGKDIDRRTDVFALGIVLFQLIAAKHPFRGDNDMITLRRICDKDPSPTLASVVPDCPPALNDLVAKALAKEADERFESMADFARGIDRAIAELKMQGLPDEDVSGFVKAMLGERAEKRRAAIREGIKTADERAEQRQQEKAQQAAMLAQLRASGGIATPSNMPPPLMSIPPPPTGSTSSIPPQPGSSAGTSSTSSLTNKAMVAELDAPAAGGGKKKFAVVAFALVGLLAIGGAVFIGTRPPAAGQQSLPPPVPSATTAPTAVATPTAKETATAPAPTETAPPAASASASANSKTGPGKTPSGPTPPLKTTGTTKGTSDNLPRVRDPGF